MARMRIVWFGTVGTMTLLPLDALARSHEIAAVVRPWPRRSRLRRAAGALARRIGLRERQPLEEWARARGLPCLTMSSGDDPAVVDRLRALAPDLICISTFRWILSPRLLAIPSKGGVNLHPSLLPRHRGPVPLYWIYHRDDRVTGVTVHRLSDRADAGEILGQERFDLPRGFPVDDLDAMNAERGAGLLASVVDAIGADRDRGLAQDESLATPAPMIRPEAPHVDFAGWGAERVWHFLAGLFPRIREPLADAAGRPVVYAGVLGYEEREPAGKPGAVTRDGKTWRLHCRDGDVILAAAEGAHAPVNGGSRTTGSGHRPEPPAPGRRA